MSDRDVASSASVDGNRAGIVIDELPNGWSVAGEIDAVTSAQLDEAFHLPDVTTGPVEIDLAGVTFIDSSGLRVLLALAGRVTAAGGTIVIRNPSNPVKRIVAITKLESTFGLEQPRSDVAND